MNFFILLILFFHPFSASAVECINTQSGDQLDSLYTDWNGVNCNPLIKETWAPNWKSPCECLSNKDKASKMKTSFNLFKSLNKDEQKLILDSFLIEKHAKKLRAQIDGMFNDSLRLDVLLKEGVINDTNNSFMPGLCRLDRLNEIASIVKNSDNSALCNQNTLKERMKLLFGKDEISDFIKDQNQNFKWASRNKLNPKDKEEGMCLPKKSFQSMNAHSPLFKSYLSVAFKFKDYDKFILWANDRSRSTDVFDILKKRKSTIKVTKGAPIGSMKSPKMLGSTLPAFNGNLDIMNDDTNDILEISDNDIKELLSSDPIFNMMTKDKSFFEDITSGKFGDENSLYRNNQDILTRIAESQNKTCDDFFAIKKPESTGNQSRNRGRATASTTTQLPKNPIINFLCNENIADDLINSDSLNTVLIPKFMNDYHLSKDEATDALTEFAVCKSSTNTQINPNGFTFSPKSNYSDNNFFADNQINTILNFNINQDQDTGKLTETPYGKFNKAICKYVDNDCKNIDNTVVNLNCSISNISSGVINGILNSKSDISNTDEFRKKIFDPNINDKDISSELQQTLKFSNEEISAILKLRKQLPDYKFKVAKDDLKRDLLSRTPSPIDTNTTIDDYINKIGGIDKIITDPAVPNEIKNRLVNFKNKYASENIYPEIVDGRNSSYFSNYFALADKDDAMSVGGADTTVPTTVTTQTTTTPTNTTNQPTSGDVSGPTPVIINTGAGTSPPPTYSRKSFDNDEISTIPPTDVTTTPISDKNIASGPVIDSTTTPQPNKPTDDKNTTKPKSPVIGGSTNGLSLSSSSQTNTEDNTGLFRSRPIERTINNDNNSNSNEEILNSRLHGLQDRLDSLNKQISKNKATQEGEFVDRLQDEKKALENQIRSIKNNGRRIANNYKDNSGQQFNNNSDNSHIFNNPYTPPINNNSGYNRGEEFNGEKAQNKLDDGSEAFDPENTNTASASNAKGKGKDGKIALSSDKGAGSSASKLNSNGSDSSLENLDGISRAVGEKCGFGAVVKCIFQHSIFYDPDDPDRFHFMIANLRLEGRKFYTLMKVRKSKKELKNGEVFKPKYYLVTHDVIDPDTNKQIDDEKRESLFLSIKTKRKDPKFRNELFKIRNFTKAVPPQKLLTDDEANGIRKRLMDNKEVEALELLYNDESN